MGGHMNNDLQSVELKQKRVQAVRTALVLGFIALAIFATFIISAVIGR
jgi:hypothetical protein